MEQGKKSRLMALTTAAKYIIFNSTRMAKFLPLLNTRDGAIKAVQAVMSVIDKKKPIEPDVAPLLAANIYMLMVDMAQEVAGSKPDMNVVRMVLSELMKTVSMAKPAANSLKPDQQAPMNKQQPAGLMGV